MDSILKLVYDNWRDLGGPLPNGRHPIVNNLLKTNTSDFLNTVQESAQQQVDGNIFLFDHSNFRGYTSKMEPVKVNEISDGVYVWPLEIRTGLESVYNTHSFVFNGERIEYSIKDTISPELLQLMVIGKVKIVINYSHDPIDQMNVLKNIEDYFNILGIHGSNVIIVPGNDCSTEYKNYHPKGQLCISPVKLLMCHNMAKDIQSFPRVTSLGYTSDIMRESDLMIGNIRPKKFLCLNRTMRPHRYALAYIALKLNLLENSVFSFLNKGNYTTDSILNDLTFFGFNDNAISNKIMELIPYQLDTHHLSDNERCGFNSANSDKTWFSNTYIHITSETRFSNGSTPFISEKTFRPIANLQPFIFVGNYHSLRYLKELGFKTFAPFIDESYDDETDYHIRIRKIYSEIERLNKLSIQEIHDWYYSITEVLLHNQKRLLDFSTLNPYQETIDYLKNL